MWIIRYSPHLLKVWTTNPICKVVPPHNVALKFWGLETRYFFGGGGILPVTLPKWSNITSKPVLICTPGHHAAPRSKCSPLPAEVARRTSWVAGGVAFLSWDSRAHSALCVHRSHGDHWGSMPGLRGPLRQRTASFPHTDESNVSF